MDFETHGRENHVSKLKKALYDLKQTPRIWYDRIDGFLSSLGFTKSKLDSNLYYKVEEGNTVILLRYVDDLFVIGVDGLNTDTKINIATEFKMKYLGMMHYFLGMEVWQNVDGIYLPQTRKVCSRDPEEIWDDGLQGHNHTYIGIEPEAIE